MTLEFVHCILGGPERASSVGPRIEHLHLNSIIEWSGTDVPLPKFDHLGELSEYYDSHRDNDFVVEPNRGMLAGVVDPLIGHCTALTSLHITTSAETTDASLTETYEDGLFKSWANLIRSTRNGLTKLVFEHIRVARHDFWDWPCSKGTILHPHFGRQIDKMFFFHILPVLVEGPWPRMKHMEFRGVGLRKAGNYTRRPPSEEALTVPYIDYTVTDRDSRRAPYKVCQIVNAFPTDAREQVARLMDEAAELVVCEYRRGVDVDRLLGETGIPSHGRVPVHSGSDME